VSALAPRAKRGVSGAIVAYFSFGSIMLATRLDRVGEAAVLRETSTVFAALIGRPVPGEKVRQARTGLMALIAAGAVVMDWAGWGAMAEKKINPVLKQVLELGPTLLFFLVYMWLKDESFQFNGVSYSGFIVAALILVPLLLASIAALWWLTGALSRMQIFVAVMVVFFGGLTAWFNDERFFKMKTTIVYSAFSLLLLTGLIRGRSWLEWIIGDMLPMRPEGWMILTRRLTGMFAALAVTNEIVWRTMSNDAWVVIETFLMPAALFIFLWAQFIALQKYVIEPGKGAK
jgi:intracellular septation protein